MEAGEKQRVAGQSLWLGHLSREQIRDGSLMHQIEECSVTGLVFSPQALRLALVGSLTYDAAIEKKLTDGLYGESLACSLIYDDVRHAADLLRSVYDRTDAVDGWAVIPVSPLSSTDNDTLVTLFQEIHRQINRPNVLLCLPALPERLEIIEELVFNGVPVNIANIYSDKQYDEVCTACLSGIERRIQAGLKSVVSTFITINVARLETALSQRTERQIATALCVAMAQKIYRTLREHNNSEQWGRVFSTGVRPLRLVWTYSGGNGMLDANCDLYGQLIAPYTIVALPGNTISEFLCLPVSGEPMPVDGGDCDRVLADGVRAGLDVGSEADNLQSDYLDWMAAEWVMLLENVARRSASVTRGSGDQG